MTRLGLKKDGRFYTGKTDDVPQFIIDNLDYEIIWIKYDDVTGE